jgi:hypothetical protein
LGQNGLGIEYSIWVGLQYAYVVKMGNGIDHKEDIWKSH